MRGIEVGADCMLQGIEAFAWAAFEGYMYDVQVDIELQVWNVEMIAGAEFKTTPILSLQIDAGIARPAPDTFRVVLFSNSSDDCKS